MVRSEDRVIKEKEYNTSTDYNKSDIKIAEEFGRDIGTVAANIVTDLPSAPKAIIKNFGAIKDVVSNSVELGGKKAAALLMSTRINMMDKRATHLLNQIENSRSDDTSTLEKYYDDMIYQLENDSQALIGLKKDYNDLEGKNIDMISNMDNHVARYGTMLASGMVEGMTNPIDLAQTIAIGAVMSAAAPVAITAAGLSGGLATATNVGIRYGADALVNVAQLNRDTELLKDRTPTQEENIKSFLSGVATRAALDGTKMLLDKGFNQKTTEFFNTKANPNVQDGGYGYKLISQKEIAKMANDFGENVPNITNKTLFYRSGVSSENYNPVLDPRNPRVSIDDKIMDISLPENNNKVYSSNMYGQPVEIDIDNTLAGKQLSDKYRNGEIDGQVYEAARQDLKTITEASLYGDKFVPQIEYKKVDQLGFAIKELSSKDITPLSKSIVKTDDGLVHTIFKRENGTLDVVTYRNGKTLSSPTDKSYIELRFQDQLENTVVYNYDPVTGRQTPIKGAKKYNVLNNIKRSDKLDNVTKSITAMSNQLQIMKSQANYKSSGNGLDVLPVNISSSVDELSKYIKNSVDKNRNELFDNVMYLLNDKLGNYYSTSHAIINNINPNAATRALIFDEIIDVMDNRYIDNPEVSDGFNALFSNIRDKSNLALDLQNKTSVIDDKNASTAVELSRRFPNVVEISDDGTLSYKLSNDELKDLTIDRIINPNPIKTGIKSSAEVGDFEMFKKYGITSLDDFDKLIGDQFTASEINERALNRTLTPEQMRFLGEYNIFTKDSNGISTMKSDDLVQAIISMGTELMNPDTPPEQKIAIQNTLDGLMNPTDKLPQKIITPNIAKGDIEVAPQSVLSFVLHNSDDNITVTKLNGMMSQVSNLVSDELQNRIDKLDLTTYQELLQGDKARTKSIIDVKNDYVKLITEFENSSNKNQLLQTDSFNNKVQTLINKANELDPEIKDILGLDQLQEIKPIVYNNKIKTGLEVLSAVNQIPETKIKSMEVNVNAVNNSMPELKDMISKLSRNKDTKKYVTTSKFKNNLTKIMNNIKIMQDSGIDTTDLKKLIEHDYSNFSSKADKQVLLDVLNNLSKQLDGVSKNESDRLRAINKIKNSLTKSGNVKNTLKSKSIIDSLSLVSDLLDGETSKYSYDDISEYIKYIKGDLDKEFDNKFINNDIWVDTKSTLTALDTILQPRSIEDLNTKTKALSDMIKVYKDLQTRVGKTEVNASRILKNMDIEDYADTLKKLNEAMGSPYTENELLNSKYYNMMKEMFDNVKEKISENPLDVWTQTEKKRPVRVNGTTQRKLDRLNQYMKKNKWLMDKNMYRKDLTKETTDLVRNIAVHKEKGLSKELSEYYGNPNVPALTQSPLLDGAYDTYIDPRMKGKFDVVYDELGKYAKQVPIVFDEKNMPTAYRGMTKDEFVIWYDDMLDTLNKTRNISNSIARFEGESTYYLKDLIPYFKDTDSMLRFFTDYIDSRNGYLETNELALHTALNKNCELIAEHYTLGTSMTGFAHTLKNVNSPFMQKSLKNSLQKFNIGDTDYTKGLNTDTGLIAGSVANTLEASTYSKNRNLLASSFVESNPEKMLDNVMQLIKANILIGVGVPEAYGKSIATRFNIFQPSQGATYNVGYAKRTAKQVASNFKGIFNGVLTTPTITMALGQAAVDNVGALAEALSLDKFVSKISKGTINPNFRKMKDFDVSTAWETKINSPNKTQAKFIANSIKAYQLRENLAGEYRNKNKSRFNNFIADLSENANTLQNINNVKAFVLSYTHTSELMSLMKDAPYETISNRDLIALNRAGITKENFPIFQSALNTLVDEDGVFKVDLSNIGETFLKNYDGDPEIYEQIGDIFTQIFNRGMKENPDIDIEPKGGTQNLLTKAVTSFTKTVAGAGKELLFRLAYGFDKTGLRVSRFKNFKDSTFSQQFTKVAQTAGNLHALLLPLAVAGTLGGLVQTLFKNPRLLNKRIAEEYGKYKTMGDILTGNESEDKEFLENAWFIYKNLAIASSKQVSLTYFLGEGTNIFQSGLESATDTIHQAKMTLADMGVNVGTLNKIDSVMPLGISKPITNAEVSAEQDNNHLALFLFAMATTLPAAPLATLKPVYEAKSGKYGNEMNKLSNDLKKIDLGRNDANSYARDALVRLNGIGVNAEDTFASNELQKNLSETVDWDNVSDNDKFMLMTATNAVFKELLDTQKEMELTKSLYTFQLSNKELLDKNYIDEKEYDRRIIDSFKEIGTEDKYENLSPSYKYAFEDIIETKTDLSPREEMELKFNFIADKEKGMSTTDLINKYADNPQDIIRNINMRKVEDKPAGKKITINDLSISYQYLWEDLQEEQQNIDEETFLQLYNQGKSISEIRKMYE